MLSSFERYGGGGKAKKDVKRGQLSLPLFMAPFLGGRLFRLSGSIFTNVT